MSSVSQIFLSTLPQILTNFFCVLSCFRRVFAQFLPSFYRVSIEFSILMMHAATLIYFIFTLLLSGVFGTLCPNMQSGGDTWYCLPCGGVYTCTFNGDPTDMCYAASTDISCSLPYSATQWMCCRDCDVSIIKIIVINNNNICILLKGKWLFQCLSILRTKFKFFWFFFWFKLW